MSRDLIFTILGIDKGSDAFDKVGKSADDAKDRLSTFSSVGTKVLAAFPVAALGAGVATAGALTVVGAAVAGAAALILHNNDQVAASAGELWANLRTQSQAAAAPLAKDLTGALNTVNQAITDLAPQFNQLFASSGPAIQHLTNGVVMLARNAMPGFVTAIKSSEPALAGMESFLGSTGTGITRFFTNISTGAESSGRIMTSTGRIVSDFLGFAGSLFAELSNSGAPAVATLEGFLRNLEGTVLSLAHGAFPGLASAASGFLSVGSGILSILGLFAPILGPIIGQLGTFAIALKLVNAVSFGQVSVGFAGLKQAIGDAEGVTGKFKAGIGALSSTGLLPLGVVAAGLGLILTGLGSAQQRAAQEAAAHESRIQNLTGALKASNGAINDNVRALAAKSLSEQQVGDSGKSVLEVARESGISLSQLTDAYLGNADAQKAVTGTLDAYAVSMSSAEAGTSAEANRALDLKNMLPGLNSEYGTSAQKAKDLAAATGDAAKATQILTPAQEEAKAAASKLHGAFDTLKDSMKSVAEKGAAVLQVLDQLSGKSPDLREATQAWDDLARSLDKKTDWNSAADGVQKLNKNLVDMKGEVNTTTEAGSKLQDWAQSSAVAFANSAAAMKSAGIPADEMSKKLGVMRQQFIDNAVAQGLPRDAALRLADAYHLVPGQVSTLVLTPNLAQKMAEMGVFAYTVRSLPDGSIVVTSNTGPAQGNITKLIQDNNGKVITLRINTTAGTVRNMAGGLPAAASGTDYAPGGLMLVGEEGPEVMEVPRGARIHDAVKSAHMLSVGGGSKGIAMNAAGGFTFAPVFTGPVGSQRELQNWLTLALDDLKRKGRLPT